MNSQSVIFNKEYYGVENGLSHRDVQSTVQDDRGFLWFGTRSGLNRFDGRTIKSIDHSPLATAEINHLLKDANGMLWLINTAYKANKVPNSIIIFNPTTEKSSDFQSLNNNKNPINVSDILCIGTSGDNTILMVTRRNELWLYNGTFQKIDIDNFAFDEIYDIKMADENQIWMSYVFPAKYQSEPTKAIIAFNQKGEITKNFIPKTKTDFLEIYDFNEDLAPLFIKSVSEKNNFFFRLDHNSMPQSLKGIQSQLSIKEKLESLDDLAIVHESKNGLVFIAKNGLQILDTQKDEIIFTDQKSPSFQTITEIYEDNDGNFWICTQFGFYRITIQSKAFNTILQDNNDQLNSVRGLRMDKNMQLWASLSSESQLFKIDLENPKDLSIQINSQTRIYDFEFGKNQNLCYLDQNNLHRINTEQLKSKQIALNGQKKIQGTVWALYLDKYNIFWFATDSGQIGYVENNKINFLKDLNKTKNLFYSYQFKEMLNGETWLVTEGGIFVLDPVNKKIIDHYYSGADGNKFLPFDNIHHVHEDSIGSYWLATSKSGLIHWIPKKENVKQYTRSDGLSNNTLYGIYEDSYNNLWISSDYGINKFNKLTETFESFDISDGLSHNEFNRISHLQDDNGTIYFGSLNGITYFHPKNIHSIESSKNYPIVISAFHQYVDSEQRLVDLTHVINNDYKITMQPKDNFFQLEFNLLNYSNNENHQYAYKFDGADDDWIYQSENFIRISHLKYGKHKLRIKGQDASGKWSSNELLIDINRRKPLIIRNWFLALIALFLIAAGAIIHWFRTKKLRGDQLRLKNIIDERMITIKEKNDELHSQAQKLKNLDEIKSDFFSNIAHELRTPLTILLGPINSILKSSQLDERNTILLANAQKSGKNLLNLINQIMDLSKLESNKLTLKERAVKVNELLNKIVSQFAEQAVMQNLSLNARNECDPRLTISIDDKKFEHIVNNYLSNAIKFSPEGSSIELSLQDQGNDLLLTVKDFGEGIPAKDIPFIFDRYYQSLENKNKSDSGTGIGLALVNEYANLMGGRAWAESRLGEGSSFYVKFPKKEISSTAQIEDFISINHTEILKDEAFVAKSFNLPYVKTKVDKEKKEILIVEDNPELREYLTILFAREYTIAKAKNGKEALSYLTNGHDTKLIITDLMMPVMDGFELIKNIKKNDKTRHLPVIVLTAKVNIKDKISALRIGVDDYVIKPFEEEELLTRVNNLIDRNYELDEIEKPNKSTEIKLTKMSESDALWLAEIEKRAFEEMEKQLLTVNWLAHLSHLSERQFRRKLQKTTGLSPQKYITHLRLQAAREMLEKGQFDTILEIAYKVGFSDASSFSRSYRNHFGVSPSTHFNI